MEARWRVELEAWLVPFLDALGHKTRARMCPAYLALTHGNGEVMMSQAEHCEMLVLGSGEGGKYLPWHMAHSGHRTAVVIAHPAMAEGLNALFSRIPAH